MPCSRGSWRGGRGSSPPGPPPGAGGPPPRPPRAPRPAEPAAEAFARFRSAVVHSEALLALDPELLLLHTTRCAAAARVPRPGSVGLLGRRHRACDLAPELLVARAEGTLTPADRD